MESQGHSSSVVSSSTPASGRRITSRTIIPRPIVAQPSVQNTTKAVDNDVVQTPIVEVREEQRQDQVKINGIVSWTVKANKRTFAGDKAANVCGPVSDMVSITSDNCIVIKSDGVYVLQVCGAKCDVCIESRRFMGVDMTTPISLVNAKNVGTITCTLKKGDVIMMWAAPCVDVKDVSRESKVSYISFNPHLKNSHQHITFDMLDKQTSAQHETIANDDTIASMTITRIC